MRGREGGGDPGAEGDHRGLRRRSGAGERPVEPQVGGDGRRASLGDVGEQVFRLQQVQRLPYDPALDAELVGQPRLGGHALTCPQRAGPDPGAELVGHLAR